VKDLVYHRSLLPAASQFATKSAVMDGNYTATYGEHLERVLRLSDGMRRELGITTEDRYAVMALNSHHYLELYHAGFLGTGVINPLNLRLAPKELALKAWPRERIAGYKVPKSFEFRTDPLPLSGAMKVLKRELREAYVENHQAGR
jgi:acyl-CoA synthetase (AMP-forming)/AMP-acid ligase II